MPVRYSRAAAEAILRGDSDGDGGLDAGASAAQAGFGWHDALACLQLAELGGAFDDAVRTVGFFDAAHAEDVLAALLYHDARADGGGADDAAAGGDGQTTAGNDSEGGEGAASLAENGEVEDAPLSVVTSVAEGGGAPCPLFVWHCAVAPGSPPTRTLSEPAGRGFECRVALDGFDDRLSLDGTYAIAPAREPGMLVGSAAASLSGQDFPPYLSVSAFAYRTGVTPLAARVVSVDDAGNILGD